MAKGKRMKQVMTAVLCAAMLPVMAGCGGQGKQSTASGGDITLKWVMPGPGKQVDSERVWSKFNEELQNYLPGVSVSFEVIPTADYKQKYLLMNTGREEMDLISTYTLDFNAEARNGSFLAINDSMDKEAPALKEQLPDWLWSYTTVDDKIYAVPVYQSMQTQVMGIRTPTELANKYLDTKNAEEIFWSSRTFTKEGYDIIEDYLKQLKDAGELGLGLEPGSFQQQGYEQFLVPYAVKYGEEHPKVVNIWQTEETKYYYGRMAQWYQEGYIRQDILSVQKSSNDRGKEGGYTMWLDQTIKNSAEKDTNKYGMDIAVIPLQNYFYIPSVAAAGGTAISARSKHATEAIKLLELLNTDKGKDLYRLLVFGFEGEHYKKISEDRVETIGYIGQAGSTAPYGMLKWIVGNTQMAYDTQTEFEGWNHYIFDEINLQGEKSVLMGFKPNLDRIQTKLAQVLTVKGEYASLGSGAVENWEQVYQEYMDKLELAGNQDIIDDLQKQVDEFLAKK